MAGVSRFPRLPVVRRRLPLEVGGDMEDIPDHPQKSSPLLGNFGNHSMIRYYAACNTFERAGRCRGPSGNYLWLQVLEDQEISITAEFTIWTNRVAQPNTTGSYTDTLSLLLNFVCIQHYMSTMLTSKVSKGFCRQCRYDSLKFANL